MEAPKEPTISTVYKVERKSPRSKFWVVKKFMREFFGVDEARRNRFHDTELETVSADLSRDHAYSFCALISYILANFVRPFLELLRDSLAEVGLDEPVLQRGGEGKKYREEEQGCEKQA